MADEILKIRPQPRRKWDCVSFGEVMLRFDPGFGRVRNAREFQVWEGGGEYNVARAMKKCWGKRAAVVTALPKNDLGWLVEDLIMQGGVEHRTSSGATSTASAATPASASTSPKRASASARRSAAPTAATPPLRRSGPAKSNWEKLFGEEGVRWFHTGGIFAALAPNTAEAVIEAVEAAHKYGTIVSYDLNYRASLWKSQGGQDAARRRSTARSPSHVDVMIGNEEDFTACLGFEVEGLDEHISKIEPATSRR